MKLEYYGSCLKFAIFQSLQNLIETLHIGFLTYSHLKIEVDFDMHNIPLKVGPQVFVNSLSRVIAPVYQVEIDGKDNERINTKLRP